MNEPPDLLIFESEILFHDFGGKREPCFRLIDGKYHLVQPVTITMPRLVEPEKE